VSEKCLKTRFKTEKDAILHYINVRYKGVITCPHCGSSSRISFRNDRPKVFQCNSCNNSFSVFKGTIFEKSSTYIRIWFDACRLLLDDKKGMPATLLKRQIMTNYTISITYKCAWRILNRIRIAMGNNRTETMLSGMIETDETYVGPKAKRNKWGNNKKGRGTEYKIPIHGIYERDTGKVHMYIMPPNEQGKKITGKQLKANIDKHCKKNAWIFTDEFSGYNILDKKDKDNKYNHRTVNHSKNQYSLKNGVHTNNIERAWSLMKRGGLYRRYHNISNENLQSYLNEYCFRFNYRETDIAFMTLLEKTLIQKPAVMPYIIKSTMRYNYSNDPLPLHEQLKDTYKVNVLENINFYLSKLSYTDRYGNTVYVLERAFDGYGFEFWEFDRDFSVDMCLDFLQIFDEEKRKEEAAAQAARLKAAA